MPILKVYELTKWLLILTIGVNYLIGIFWYTKSYNEWVETDVKPRKITWVVIELFSIHAFGIYFIIARHYFIKN